MIDETEPGYVRADREALQNIVLAVDLVLARLVPTSHDDRALLRAALEDLRDRRDAAVRALGGAP